MLPACGEGLDPGGAPSCDPQIDVCDGESIVGEEVEEVEAAGEPSNVDPSGPPDFATHDPISGGAFRDVWFPSGDVPYFLDASFTTTEEDAIDGAMDFLEEHTPINVTRFSDPGGLRAIRFKDVSTIFFCGKTEGYWNQNKSNPTIALDQGCANQTTTHHEMFHALGFAHEFQRPDRDDHTSICFNSDWFNYGKLGSVFWPDDHDVFSPFDFESITNVGYTGSGGCVSAVGGTFGRPQWEGDQQPLSRHDINSVYRVYGEALDETLQDGQGFGNALAAGDFDDDEIEDLVVVSREGAGSLGLVYLNFYRGVELDDGEGQAGRKFMPWFRHLLAISGSSTVQLSATAGDFNGDDIPELAVGDPSFGGTGRVYVVTVNERDLSGSTNIAPWGTRGIEDVDVIDPDDVGLQAGGSHSFGSDLVAGNLTDLDHDDLVIGAEGARRTSGSGKFGLLLDDGGAVVHLPAADPDDAIVTWNPDFTPMNPGSANEFGDALTLMPYFCDHDPNAGNDQYDTFAVGAPGRDQDAGAVYVFGCSRTQGGTPIAPTMLRRVTHSQQGARYGAAVAGFRTQTSLAGGDTQFVLAIGAPRYEASGVETGIVYLDEFTDTGTKTFLGSYRPSNTVGGDRFGASLAVFQGGDMGIVDRRFTHLAIGMPQTERNGVRSGKVYMWRPFTTTGINNSASVWSPVIPSSNMRYGRRVIAVHGDSLNGGFAIASPQAIVDGFDAGQVTVRLDRNPSSTSWSSARQEIFVDSGPDRPPLNL